MASSLKQWWFPNYKLQDIQGFEVRHRRIYYYSRKCYFLHQYRTGKRCYILLQSISCKQYWYVNSIKRSQCKNSYGIIHSSEFASYCWYWKCNSSMASSLKQWWFPNYKLQDIQ